MDKEDALEQFKDLKQRELRSKGLKEAIESKKRQGTYFDWIQKIKKTKLERYGTDVTKLKIKLLEKYGGCQICGKKEQVGINLTKLLIHYLSYDNLVLKEKDAMLVCRNCHSSLHNKRRGNDLLEREKQVTKRVLDLLKVLDIDIQDENFFETPRRFSAVLREFVMSWDSVEQVLEECKSSIFTSELDQMIILKEIVVYGLCPHHLLPVRYEVDIGSLPEKFVIGLSKYYRIVEILAKIPMLQETLTMRIRDVLSVILSTKNVIVRVIGKHLCMGMRGIKQSNIDVRTVSLGGCFLEDSVKQEFLSNCKGGGK